MPQNVDAMRRGYCLPPTGSRSWRRSRVRIPPGTCVAYVVASHTLIRSHVMCQDIPDTCVGTSWAS
jgi:hypothetical protein